MPSTKYKRKNARETQQKNINKIHGTMFFNMNAFFPFVVIRSKNWDVSGENDVQHHASGCLAKNIAWQWVSCFFSFSLIHSFRHIYFRTSITYQFIRIIIVVVDGNNDCEANRRREWAAWKRWKNKKAHILCQLTQNWCTNRWKIQNTAEVKLHLIKIIVYFNDLVNTIPFYIW